MRDVLNLTLRSLTSHVMDIYNGHRFPIALPKASWFMVEEYLKKDDRIVFVLGATEEHGPNTLSTDTQIPSLTTEPSPTP